MRREEGTSAERVRNVAYLPRTPKRRSEGSEIPRQLSPSSHPLEIMTDILPKKNEEYGTREYW